MLFKSLCYLPAGGVVTGEVGVVVGIVPGRVVDGFVGELGFVGVVVGTFGLVGDVVGVVVGLVVG